MKIELSKAGKRFNRQWIFRKANCIFHEGNSYAVTGPNGSGKSTLLQCIAGMLQLNEGKINLIHDDVNILEENLFKNISFCAPYLEVIEEMTLLEFFHFHFTLKPIIKGITVSEIIDLISLRASVDKQIRYYSSGMKQRVKLAQAFFSKTEILLLDEPCSNLDDDGITLYKKLITNFTKDRITIVCSNDKVEYDFCNEVFSMTAFKS